MQLAKILAALEIIPDSSGRFFLPFPLPHPGGDGLSTVKFRLTDGQLFDGYNRLWSTKELWEALRKVGRLPEQLAADGTHCMQCGAALTGRQTRFCSPTCRTIFKREAMRELRGFNKPHRHVCRVCGRSFHVGRPPKAAQTL